MHSGGFRTHLGIPKHLRVVEDDANQRQAIIEL